MTTVAEEVEKEIEDELKSVECEELETEANDEEEPKEEALASVDTAEEEPLSVRERKHMAKVAKLEKQCAEIEAAYGEAKFEAVARKKELEGKISELRRLIRRGPSSQQELPFDSEPGSASESEATANAGPPKTKPEEDDSWKLVSITDALTLTDKQKEKFESIGVKTVGAFEDLRAGKHKDYPNGLLDVEGVGQKKVDLWEDEMSEFWEQRGKL